MGSSNPKALEGGNRSKTRSGREGGAILLALEVVPDADVVAAAAVVAAKAEAKILSSAIRGELDEGES